MNKKILSGVLALSMLFSVLLGMAPAGAQEAVPTAAAGTAEVDHSKLMTLFEEDFTTLEGSTDAQLKEEIVARGWSMGTGGDALLELSKDDQRGLHIKRMTDDTSKTPTLTKVITDTNGKITDTYAAVPGYNMKSGGKYYIAWTTTYDGAFARFDAQGTSYKNVFMRSDMNYRKKDQAEFFTPNIDYHGVTEGEEYLVEVVVDVKDGNLTGREMENGESVVKFSAYINGVKVTDNKPLNAISVKNQATGETDKFFATYINKLLIQQPYTKFVTPMDLTKGVNCKKIKIAKIVDAGAADFDKAYMLVAPQTQEPLSAVTQNLTLPDSFQADGAAEGCTVTWTSTDDGVVNGSGEVTRSADEDKTAVLTAAITGAGGESTTKKFNVTVKKTEEPSGGDNQGTAEVDHSKLVPIFEEDFTTLEGSTDAQLREELAGRGWEVTETAGSEVTFSMDGTKGVYMQRKAGDTTTTPLIKNVIADTGTVNGVNNEVSGYNMKSKGKYYVSWTITYDGTFTRLNTEGAGWRNVFAQCDLSNRQKDKAEFYTDLTGYKYTPLEIGSEYVIEAVVDTKEGNLAGDAATATISAYINGEKILDNKPSHVYSGGYTSFLRSVQLQLHKKDGNTVGGKGCYFKKIKIAKLVDDGAADFDKAYMLVAPQTQEPLSAVTQNLTLPDSFQAEGAAEGCSVTWTSTDDGVVNGSGEVTRSADEDKTAVLTAHITGAGGETAAKDFTVTVKQVQLELDDVVNYTDLTDEAVEPVTPPVVITKSLIQPLKSTFEGGGTISWKSSDTSWLGDDGTLVKRPTKYEEDQPVELEANITTGSGEEVKRTFQFLIKKEEVVYTFEDDVIALSEEAVLNGNASANEIVTELELPKTGKYAGSTIVWSAEPQENCPIDPDTGKVLAPESGEPVPVTLTAVLTSADGQATRTLTFDLVVPVLYAPTENLALKKPATSNSNYGGNYNPPQAFDGDKGTRWGSNITENIWLRVDLGKSRLFNQVNIYEFEDRMLEMRIEYSDDGQNWKTACTSTSEGGTKHRTQNLKFSPVKGRYVRVFIPIALKAPTIFEFEIYDTATRKYTLEAAANESALGQVNFTQGSDFLAAGEPVTMQAAAKETSKFIHWELPEGLELTEGTADGPQISFNMPAKNIAVTAVFEEKVQAETDIKTAVFDKYEKSQQHQDIAITFHANEFTLEAVRCGGKNLTQGEQFTKTGDVYIIKKEFLKTLEGNQTVTFRMNAGTNPSVAITVTNSDPVVAVPADLKEVKLPSSELKDGDVIAAVGAIFGSDISVTSNSDVVTITRETQGGILVNKINVRAPRLSTLVTLTVTASKEDVKQSLSYKFSVKGTGGGSIGGGGGGGSSSGGSSGGGNYGGGTVNWNSGNGQGNVQQPVNTPAPDGTFGDMDQAQWAKEAVKTLKEKGVVKGDENGNFNPGAQVTREEFIKMAVLAMDMEPAAGAATPFEDVEAGAWYAPYVAAAYEKNIVGGVTDSAFGVGTSLTRQDAAVMLDRIAGETLGTGPADATFADADAVGAYALDSVKRVAAAGLMKGYPDGSFRPEQTMTRAETAQVLAQLMKLREGGEA